MTHPSLRGGGGGTSILCTYWVCVIFSPKFPLQNIIIIFTHTHTHTHTHKIRSGSSPFSEFPYSVDHYFQNLFTFKPFRRSPRPVYCGKPAREVFCQRPGVTAGREYQRDTSCKSAPETPISRTSPLQSPAFSRASRSRAPPPHVLLCRGTCLSKFGPSAPRPSLLHTIQGFVINAYKLNILNAN